MPPKVRYSREMITDAAFEIARNHGMDSINARNVGAAIGATVSPIFTAFGSMQELKEAVIARIEKECTEFLSNTVSFRVFTDAWMEFAANEPNLYDALLRERGMEYLGKEFRKVSKGIITGIQKSFELTEEEAMELLEQSLIHAHGITVHLDALRKGKMTLAQAQRSMQVITAGMVLYIKQKNGTLTPERAAKILTDCEELAR